MTLDSDAAKPGDLPSADAEQLRQFLASAPAELKGWAAEQLAVLDGSDRPGKPATEDEAADQAVGLEAFAEFGDDEPVFGQERAIARSRPTVQPAAAKKGVSGVGKVNLILVALLAAAVVIIVQQLGRTTPSEVAAMGNSQASAMPGAVSGAASSAASEFPPLDETRVAELKKQAEAEPDNVGVLRDLGKLYFDSGLYQDAIVFFERALGVQPDDVEVLLSLGVAQYGVNNYAAAEQHWLRATEIDPKLAEPWYNLGFLYLAQTPPNYDGVEMAWGKVIEIDPSSELALTAKAHLERVRASSDSSRPGG